MKTLIADAVAREIKERAQTDESTAKADKQLNDYFVSLVQSIGNKKTPAKPAANVADTTGEDKAPVSLSSILAKVQQRSKKE
jgi:hypothetical protein